MKHNAYPAHPETITDTIEKLSDAAARRDSTHPQNLAPRQPYQPKTVELSRDVEPMAKLDHFSGNLQESLQTVVIIGDTMLGISRDINMKPEAKGDEVEKVRIFAFSPPDAQGNPVTSQTIATYTRADWTKHYAGYPMRPMSVTLGRGLLMDTAGIVDTKVSRDHATMDIGINGAVRITDTSTNGTQVLDMHALDPQYGLDPTGQNDFANFRNELEQNPYLWAEKAAGGQVIVTGAQG